VTTQLEIYNLALSHIKETQLAAVDEAREARYVLDTHYDQDLRWMLEAGFWKFAMRTVKIDYDPDTATAFGMSRVFNKPEDWVRTYLVSGSERLDPPLDDWIEEGNTFIADVTPIYVRYVSNSETGYGMDMTRWTARFIEAFSWRLAHSIAPKITGASDNSKGGIKDSADNALKEALTFEAMREPSRRPPDGRWNKARFSGYRGSSGGHRYA
jgi:hypothetical protein